MRTAKLKILGIEIPLAEGHTFHDDGFVDDIETHARKLIERYPDRNFRMPYELEETVYGLENVSYGLENALGLCAPFVKDQLMDVHICYVNQNNYQENTRIRAHEETHAAEKLTRGKLKIPYFFPCDLVGLSKKMFNEQEVRINFREINNSELIAELGSIYALVRNGVPFSKIKRDYSHESYASHYAIQIYEQARPSKLSIVKTIFDMAGSIVGGIIRLK